MAEGRPSSHRLFVALTLDSRACATIHAWAQNAYSAHAIRIIEPLFLHTTLLFFPAVSDDDKLILRDTVASLSWAPLEVRTGRSFLGGQNALAIDLEAPASGLADLNRRLLRGKTVSAPVVDDPDPLRRLTLIHRAMGHVERRSLRLHVTFARIPRRVESPVPTFDMQPMAATLEKVKLFESWLGVDGASYEVVAESR